MLKREEGSSNLYLNWDKVVRYLNVCIFLSPVAVAGCELLVVTGTARVLLLTIRDLVGNQTAPL